MSKHFKSITTTLLATGFVLSLPGVSVAEEKSGTETVELSKIFAVQNNGSRAPEMDAACKEKHGARLGSKITSKYDINTVSLIMTAQSEVFSVPVVLHPLGISGIYSFMSDGVGQQLEKEGVKRVIFSVSSSFDNPESDVMMGLDDNYNCILSNMDPA